MWQDNKDTTDMKLNRLELKFYCKDLDLVQRSDWRVPSYEEMITLVDYQKANPVNKNIIKHIVPSRYWTSSQSVLKKDHNWFVDFKYGRSDIDSDLVRYNIRCVRDLSMKRGEY